MCGAVEFLVLTIVKPRFPLNANTLTRPFYPQMLGLCSAKERFLLHRQIGSCDGRRSYQMGREVGRSHGPDLQGKGALLDKDRQMEIVEANAFEE